jgi:hypothetical protein
MVASASAGLGPVLGIGVAVVLLASVGNANAEINVERLVIARHLAATVFIGHDVLVVAMGQTQVFAMYMSSPLP